MTQKTTNYGSWLTALARLDSVDFAVRALVTRALTRAHAGSSSMERVICAPSRIEEARGVSAGAIWRALESLQRAGVVGALSYSESDDAITVELRSPR